MNTYSQRTLEALTRQNRASASRTRDPGYKTLRVFPTCPPSTALYVSGGRCATQKDFYYDETNVPLVAGGCWTLPTQSYDLKDSHNRADEGAWETNPTTPPLTWSVVGGYKAGILHLCIPRPSNAPQPGDWMLALWCFRETYATGPEAEVAFQDWISKYENPGLATSQSRYWPYISMVPEFTRIYVDTGYPLCGVVLRNDGNTSPGRNFLPIDSVNRGRSYLWPQDMRPQTARWQP